MLVTDKKEENGILYVKMGGAIKEENINFKELIGVPQKELHVNCKDVESINSIGLRRWIEYFRFLRSNGTKIKFIQCSPVIVAHVGMIYDVANRDEIESVSVPFYCDSCKLCISEIYKMEDLKSIQFNLPDVICPRCKSPAAFDELPEEYFKTLLG